MSKYLSYSKLTSDVYLKHTGKEIDRIITRLLFGNRELSQMTLNVIDEYICNCNINYTKFERLGGDLVLNWDGEHVFSRLKEYGISEETLKSLMKIVLEIDTTTNEYDERERMKVYIQLLNEVVELNSDHPER